MKATVYSDIYRRFPGSSSALKYSLIHLLDKFSGRLFEPVTFCHAIQSCNNPEKEEEALKNIAQKRENA